MALFGLIKGNKKAVQKYGRVQSLPKKKDRILAEADLANISSTPVKDLNTSTNLQNAPAPLQQKQHEIVLPYYRETKKDDPLLCRYELKYRISESKAQAVKAYVQNFLPIDKYALSYPDRQYPISSLYFDSDNLDLCKETMIGKANRFKLRIRAYDDFPESPVYFEIKRRIDKVILKSRARIKRADTPSLLAGTITNPCASAKDQEALNQFLYYKQMIMGHPVVLVRYIREPFEGDTESRVRVTFDRQLSYREVSEPEVVLNGSGWRRISISFVILEIKFSHHYPDWLRRMVCLFDLNRCSMSKYVTSVKESRQVGFQEAFSYYLE